MADLTDAQGIAQTISDLMSSLTDSVGNITNNLTKVPDMLTASSTGFDKISTSAKQTASSVNIASGSLVDFTNKLSGAFDKMKSLTGESSGQISGLTKVLVDMGAVGAASMLPISSAFSELGENAKGSGNIIDDKYKSIINSVSKVAGAVIAHAEANKKAEIGLVGLYAKAGDLNEAFKRTSSGIESLSDLTNQFANQMEEIGIATGSTTGETADYAKMLLTIPGAYSKVISDSPVGSINLLKAAMTVARGSTQDFKDVFDLMSQQFKNFGQVGKEPLELMSQMYSASQNLGLPFEYINSQVKKTSDQFKFFGDNTSAALKILSGFAPALKESGVGPAGIQEIVGNLTDAVGSLDIAQKSFLSAQTGGAGGLQGGYQIDLLMKQGKMDEVFSKMETALKKQFGKIVSLEDAAKSPEAAGQLTKQVAFMRQGPFGQVAKSDSEAYKILDAFKMGAKPATEKPTEKHDAFVKVLDQGSAMQERHNNLLTIASNNLDRFSSSVGDINHKLVRDMIGTGGDQRGGPMNELIMQRMGEANDNAASEQPNKTGGEDAFIQSFGKGIDLIGKTSESVINSITNGMPDKIKNNIGKESDKKTAPEIEKSSKDQSQTVLPSYIQPIDAAAPQLTPVNRLQNMITQFNPDAEANATRNNLINSERQKNVNINKNTETANMSKDDTLTIILKTDSGKEERLAAKIHGKIKRIEKGETYQGFSID